jgi:hypothetical protein
MNRLARFVIVALALSCGTKPPAPAVVQAPKPVEPVRTPGPQPPVPVAHASRAAVEAPHTGTIQIVAATQDGGAALTIDDTGAARLWPTLDGTHEPRIVELPLAKKLGFARIADGYSAFVLDESGGLYIGRLDSDGRTRAHTTHGIDPAFSGIAMTLIGALAWRVDHHVLRIDADGVIHGDLATEPQQRIVDIAVAGNRAVAILDRAGTRQARWLAVQPRLAWGEWIPLPANIEIGTSIALAPDHEHIALTVVDGKGHKIVILDDKGREVGAQNVVPVAPSVQFADSKLLAIGGSTGISWVTVGDNLTVATAPTLSHAIRQRETLAAGGGRAIVGSNGDLMLVTPTDTKFLGYGTLTPRLAQPAADGTLVVNMTTKFHQLDAKLAAIASPWLARAGAQTSDMQWLGGTDFLVESGASSRSDVELVLVDSAKGSATVVREALPEAHVLGYEPSTDLATLSFGSAAEVARLDRNARTLTRIASVAAPTPYEQTVFVPLAPKLARGMQLLEITLRDKPAIKWLADAKALDKPAATLVLDGSYAAADAAGHVYAWRNAGGKLQLTIYTDGKVTGTLPTAGPATLWPDAAGTRIAELAQNTVTVYAADGKPLWSRDIISAQEALWLTDGALAVTHSTGVIRIDPATGAVLAARCGWEFGLSSTPHPLPARIESVCMQMLR